jgi:hypothetical protein
MVIKVESRGKCVGKKMLGDSKAVRQGNNDAGFTSCGVSKVMTHYHLVQFTFAAMLSDQ